MRDNRVAGPEVDAGLAAVEALDAKTRKKLSWI